jgi:hypothetical protein
MRYGSGVVAGICLLTACGQLKDPDPFKACDGLTVGKVSAGCVAPVAEVTRTSPDRVRFDAANQAYEQTYDFTVDLAHRHLVELSLSLTYPDFGQGAVATRFSLVPRSDLKVTGSGCEPSLRSVGILFNDGSNEPSGAYTEGLAPVTRAYQPSMQKRPMLRMIFDESGVDWSGCSQLSLSLTLQARKI